jgi:hypothetical protein
MSVIDSVINELKELPSSKLEEVVRYIHTLNTKGVVEHSSPGLSKMFGSMKGEAGEEFERAIKAEADRINADLEIR